MIDSWCSRRRAPQQVPLSARSRRRHARCGSAYLLTIHEHAHLAGRDRREKERESRGFSRQRRG